jgi:hypothetical protein
MVRISILLLLTSSILIFSCEKEDTESCGINYEQLSDFPETAKLAVGDFVVNNEAYVFASSVSLISELPTTIFLYKYNPSSDSWVKVSESPTLYYGGDVSSFVIGGSVYCTFPTYGGSSIMLKLYEYDVVENSWNEKSSTSYDDTGFSSSRFDSDGFSVGGKGYLFAETSTDNFRSYDPISDTWAIEMNYPPSDAINKVGFAVGNDIYLGGGQCQVDCYSYSFNQYNVISKTWTAISGAPAPWQFTNDAVFVLNNEVYVFSGGPISETSNEFGVVLFKYNASNDSWENIGACTDWAYADLYFSLDEAGYVGFDFTNNGVFRVLPN